LLPTQVIEEMFAQARAELPNECCGILAGILDEGGVGRVVRRYPLTNTADSPTLYRGEGKDRFAAERDMREHGLDVLAVYHSHPTTEPLPSKTDRELWGWGPEIVCLIISLKTDTPVMRGWRLTAETATEAEWAAV
jgi:proteasome lid subunit RPN8/RPN11